MGVHSFRLNENEINNALFNMIISQQVFADNIAGTFSSLVNKAKVDGSLYGDKKVYYSTDVIETHAWLNDNEAANLLSLDRNKTIDIDVITLDQFRQIRCTVDEYLSKRAFGNEGVFGSYNAVLLGWIRDTKRVHDSKMYNVFIGTNKATAGKQNISVTLPAHGDSETNVEAEAVDRRRGQALAKEMADLIVDLRDATRDYNDNGFLRSYDEGSIKVIWNSDYVNAIEKIDLPSIFHKDGLMVKMSEDILPGKYFGNAIAEGDAPSSDLFTVDSTNHKATVKSGNVAVRSATEQDITVSGTKSHLFAGDIIPAGAEYELDTSDKFKASIAGLLYVVDAKKICVVVKDLPPFMSAFEVSTSFFNPRSLTTNHYLTYGYNTLKHLKNYPFIVIKEA